jgi:hypothetical protein
MQPRNTIAAFAGHHVSVFTYRGEARDDMGSDNQDDGGTATATTLRREVCDKCGTRMELLGSARGFERWKCPGCRQVIGIDRDPEVGSRFQLARGQPWNYSPDIFRT